MIFGTLRQRSKRDFGSSVQSSRFPISAESSEHYGNTQRWGSDLIAGKVRRADVTPPPTAVGGAPFEMAAGFPGRKDLVNS